MADGELVDSLAGHKELRAGEKPAGTTTISSWDALEDAFENNAPQVHSYLHVGTGEVIRMVDGVADPAMHSRIMGDSRYLRIDPVSSREQYRWMERFIGTVESTELKQKLFRAIDGKGAFRRFKDVLVSYPAAREQWFSFRSERVRACIDAWLTAHGIEAEPRRASPASSEVGAEITPMQDVCDTQESASPAAVDHEQHALAQRLLAIVGQLSSRQKIQVIDFAEFLLCRSGREWLEGTIDSGARVSDLHHETDSIRSDQRQSRVVGVAAASPGMTMAAAPAREGDDDRLSTDSEW